MPVSLSRIIHHSHFLFCMSNQTGMVENDEDYKDVEPRRRVSSPNSYYQDDYNGK